MERLVSIIKGMDIPYAYDHFAEGEAPDPPFLCYLLPGSRNFSADGRVFHKVSQVHLSFIPTKKTRCGTGYGGCLGRVWYFL